MATAVRGTSLTKPKLEQLRGTHRPSRMELAHADLVQDMATVLGPS